MNMNPSTLAYIIQQLIAVKEENDALIEKCARLNQLLHPMPEQQHKIEQEPEIDQPEIDQPEIDQPEIDQPEIDQPEIQQEPAPGAATSIARAWPIIADDCEEANL
jgi:hypothetical protein